MGRIKEATPNLCFNIVEVGPHELVNRSFCTELSKFLMQIAEVGKFSLENCHLNFVDHGRKMAREYIENRLSPSLLEERREKTTSLKDIRSQDSGNKNNYHTCQP